MATKYSILTDRLATLRAEVEKAEAYLASLDRTPCGLDCSGCGTRLATEGDFARHFTVPDSRYLNLGECPVGAQRVTAVAGPGETVIMVGGTVRYL